MRWPIAAITTVALTAALLPVPALASDCRTAFGDDPVTALARTDHDVTGNRVAPGCGPLAGDVLEVELSGRPAWVLPDPSERGTSWFVVLEDGTVDHVIDEGDDGAYVSRSERPPLRPGDPPLALATGDDEVVVGSALGAAGWFPAPLPDARVTEIAGSALVALSGPTDRYDHGVLGDALEGAGIDVLEREGSLARIEVGPDEVIEGTSAMVLGADSGDPGLLVTVSDSDAGARLRLYDLDGSITAESAPIGQGYRWTHQIGAGVLAPDGELEIITVRTPHIGGVVEAYRLVDDQLELVASTSGYSSHQLGSANLDMALLADVDGSGRLDVVVPTQSMDELALLSRTGDGFEETGRLMLGGRLLTNVAATPGAAGSLVLAAGTDDGRLRIFR